VISDLCYVLNVGLFIYYGKFITEIDSIIDKVFSKVG